MAILSEVVVELNTEVEMTSVNFNLFTKTKKNSKYGDSLQYWSTILELKIIQVLIKK